MQRLQHSGPDGGARSPFLDPDVFRALYSTLSAKLGPGPARKVLLESFLWDPIYHHPAWHPELLPALDTPERAARYQEVFQALAPFLCLYRRLETIHGVARAQDLTAALIEPATLAWLPRVVDTDTPPPDLPALRAALSCFYGDRHSLATDEEPSTEGRCLRYRVTRSAPLEILRAYELEEAARAVCPAEGAFFTRWAPALRYDATQCLARGDACCDARFHLA